jgi:hypothetical protein
MTGTSSEVFGLVPGLVSVEVLHGVLELTHRIRICIHFTRKAVLGARYDAG